MNGPIKPSSGLSDYLNNECVTLLTSLTPAVGAICYELDQDDKPKHCQLHDIQPEFHQAYEKKFHQYDPLLPQYFRHQHHRSIVSIGTILATNELHKSTFCHQYLYPAGYQDLIDLHFRHKGKLVAGLTLFFNQRVALENKSKLAKFQAIHQFIEASIEKLPSLRKQDRFQTFSSHHKLTQKESKVFGLIIKGMSNQAIADTLYCSLATIKTHLQNIFNKLGLNSKTEVISLYLQTH